MKAVEAIRGMVEDTLGRIDPNDPYGPALARAAREKPDRMRFKLAKRSSRAAARRARDEATVADLERRGFSPEYLADRYGRRRR